MLTIYLMLINYREIIDESDVYIDVHKAIRRLAPAPKARVQRGSVTEHSNPPTQPRDDILIDFTHDDTNTKQQTMVVNEDGRSHTAAVFSTSPKTTFMRRRSAGADGDLISVRGNVNDMREHLKHLGPSNLASRPKTTRYQSVKIKPARGVGRVESRNDTNHSRSLIIEEPYNDLPETRGGEGEGLLRSAGKDASDGVLAVHQGYGSTQRSPSPSHSQRSQSKQTTDPSKVSLQPDGGNTPFRSRAGSARSRSHNSDQSSDTLGSLNSCSRSPTPVRRKGTARSGSITENIIEAGGVRKVVLETNSESSDERGEASRENQKENTPSSIANPSAEQNQKGEEVKKKRRRKRTKKNKGTEGSVDGE
jgi:metal transporter CNNM